jgi:Putative DNA-binding domain
MSLAELQRAFMAHTVSGDDAIAAMVTPDQRRGLPVYSYAYRVTLRAALRDTFEKTALWLGDDVFDAAADAYIDAHPARSWTLADYGDRFADHLAQTMPDDPEFAEIAWLDRALRLAFAAGSHPELDPCALGAVDWQTARLALAPHLAFRMIATNVIDVWNGLPDAPVAAATLDAPIGLIAWRNDLTPQFRSADPVEIAALNMLADGKSFATMYAQLSENEGSDIQAIGALLSTWLSDGLAAPTD